MLASSLKTQTAGRKFLCSYGGKILPRHPDGKLRYHGGHTRILSVHRSISFSELLVKLGELCGTSVSLRCQLPTEDLDALISITSDEDLGNLIDEYDAAPPLSLKIRAFLSIPKASAISPKSPSTTSTSRGSGNGYCCSSRFPMEVATGRCLRYIPMPAGYPMFHDESTGTKIIGKFIFSATAINGGYELQKP